MRFRGLPRDLNCGSVDLEVANPNVTGPLLPACGACSFVSVSYYVLAGCGHVLCDSCALLFPEKDDDNEEEQDYSCCSVCNETSEATAMKISITSLDKLNFQCVCGTEGTLRELRLHRRRCRETERPSTMRPDSVDGADSSFASSSGEGSSQMLDGDSISTRVKEILLEELQRVEEDILNRLELRRTPVDVQLGMIARKVEALETEAARSRIEAQRTLAQAAVPAVSAVEVQRNSTAVRNLQQQIAHLAVASAGSQANVTRWVVSHQAHSALLWFNVKKLLQMMNRLGGPATSDEQDVLIAGYPCRVHLEVDRVDQRKMLGIYIGTSNLPSQAEWPMKRRIIMKIFDSDGQTFMEEDIETMDEEAGNCFKGPNSPGCYGINDFCTIEELTNENFYRRHHGMICVGIEVRTP